MSTPLLAALGSVALLGVSLVSIRLFASEGSIGYAMLPGRTGELLIVLVHGLSGRRRFEPAVKLARECFPDADLLVPKYNASVLSNLSPYRIANTLEYAIHDQWSTGRHRRIILVGHSMGGMLVRKSLIWGHGFEEDREKLGRKGKRSWVDHVDRYVSLAGINRGWSISPKPENMSWGKCIRSWCGERIARLSGVARLLLSLRRGSPFVADSRVQWIRLARDPATGARRVPITIHLLGDRDDMVSRDDSMDLAAAVDTHFVTLPNTGHAEIAQALAPHGSADSAMRRECIRRALLGEVDRLAFDRLVQLRKDPDVTRVIYLMHGIRDYGGWTDLLRSALKQGPLEAGERFEVVNKRYGYFPMLPFLLYSDRQRNVRRFMDEYTENLARFPHAQVPDFVGHSNGTYILASALQQYRTLTVRRVFFAGSVVPKHYPWRPLIDDGRVQRVVNVQASEDWVVALFPKLFEQIADWLNTHPVTGRLDIGSGGFRGFQDAQPPIDNVYFCKGSHGSGVAVQEEMKLKAIVGYLVRDDDSGFGVFRGVRTPNAVLDVFSNISWFVWLFLVTIISLIGWSIALYGWGWLAVYVLVVVLLLNSI